MGLDAITHQNQEAKPRVPEIGNAAITLTYCLNPSSVCLKSYTLDYMTKNIYTKGALCPFTL